MLASQRDSWNRAQKLNRNLENLVEQSKLAVGEKGKGIEGEEILLMGFQRHDTVT